MDQLALSNYVVVTKIFRFEMAHVLYNHKGLCKNIHGHSYELHVSLTGTVKHEAGASDDGMLLDFSVLKSLVQEKILNDFDHAMVVNAKAPYAAELKKLPFNRLITVDYQPTCENLIRHFASLLVGALPNGMKLYRLKLYETDTSYAEWYS